MIHHLDFNWIEIGGDSIEHPVQWDGELSSLAGKLVRVEFEFQNAQLFGFNLHE